MIQKQRCIRAMKMLLVTAMIFGSSVAINIERLHAAPAEAQEIEIINVNSASLEELQVVRGIGPALADRIISFRDQNGPFEELDDLTLIRGIGSAKFERIKAQIAV